jgi:chemotaxis-related protein WspD
VEESAVKTNQINSPQSGAGGGTATIDEMDACWTRIGVYGDASCPELGRFVHCRNCQVYSDAGVKLLDRPLPEGYRRERSDHFALQKDRPAARPVSALVFRVRKEWLALPADSIQEVAEHRAIHTLPHRRQGIVAGLVNVRGELLICISLPRLLGMDKSEPHARSRRQFDRLLVVRWNNHRLVFPVEEVYGVHKFAARDLSEPPVTIGKSNLSYTRGVFDWKDHGVGFLDAELLFSTLNRSLS